jgi:iron complex outermembrane receptor protein
MASNNAKNRIKLLPAFFLCTQLVAQNDSLVLKEVMVNAYLQERPILRLPSSAAVIDSPAIQQQHGQSLVPVLNTVSGVRMEERSPGSYRLSIRGSLIRSPFGIRNTKIYLDEFPLTNAGGESYLNLLDLHCVHSVEVLKGPDGSLFGANSGGVLRIAPMNLRSKESYVTVGAGGGSFGLFQQNVGIQQHFGKNTLSVNEAWQRSDGYRLNSGMDRKYLQLMNRLQYSEKGELRFLFLYSDMQYQTPGGLTYVQYRENPKSARPANAFQAGTVEQKAAVNNQTFYGGILHEYKFTDRVRHVVAVFGSKTLFENPFITNYETRNETNGGLRTWFEFKNRNTEDVKLTMNIGAEGQVMQSLISNYDNNSGQKGAEQAIDDVTNAQGFLFTRFTADLYNKWMLEASLSYNYNHLQYTRKEPQPLPQQEKTFTPELMPRVAASYLFNDYFSVRAVVSRGYSPPSLQEIRSSNNTVNTSLQAESGWNYETGVRLRTKDERFWWDASVFYYRLNNAIVKRINGMAQDYFVNAGGTDQPGFESQFSWQLIRQNDGKIVRGLQLTNAYTFLYFTFREYSNETGDFSGNDLTGVPRHVAVTGLKMDLPRNFYVYTQFNYTSRIALDDDNEHYANEYHLLQLKAGWKFRSKKRFAMEISAGVDNLLNEQYSLGNDLNAISNRFYNAAPPLNYFGRVDFRF